MTVLIASADEDAALSVQASLKRARQVSVWVRTLNDALAHVVTQLPLVCITDTAFAGYNDLINLVRRESPWARIHLMADPGQPLPGEAGLQLILKPFDAAELASVLVRESELAELDRGKRNLQTHVDELALLVEECFEGIVGLDAGGTIRSWNPGAAALYGYAPEEALGRPVTLLELSHEVTRERLQRGDRQVVETTRRHKDGRAIDVLLSLSPMPEDARSTFRFVEVSLDVTEHRKLKRTLEHSERLAAIGRIAAGMAHEINNPLSVIHASTAYISDVAQRASDNELAECASDLRIAVDRISSFVQHICGFARRERPQLSDAPIDTAMEMATRMVRPRARAHDVEVRIGPFPAMRVPHDPPRLAQAILNLLSNAVDAAESQVELCAVVAGKELVISVEDDGPGVPEDFVARAFEPFATTKPHGQGTGLGLAITRQIVDEHGGTVTLSRRDVGGTRAELRLPLLDPGRHRVIILEDDQAVRRALLQDLRREGFDVQAPETLPESERELRRGASAVISDVAFCTKQGAELFDWIRAACPQAGRLLLTDESATRRLGGAVVVGKPWVHEALLSALRQVCVDAATSAAHAVAALRAS